MDNNLKNDNNEINNNEAINNDNNNNSGNDIPVIELPEPDVTEHSVSLEKPAEEITSNNNGFMNSADNTGSAGFGTPVNNGPAPEFMYGGPQTSFSGDYNPYGNNQQFQGDQMNQQYQSAPVNQPAPNSGKATGSLICGICSIVFCPLGLILGGIALALGIGSKKDTGKLTGIAIAGIITGSIGAIFGLIAATYIVFVCLIMGASMDSYMGKAEVKSDIQLCDTLCTAIKTTINDPDIYTERDYDVPSKCDCELDEFIEYLGDDGEEYFYDIMGYDSADEINGLLKGTGHKGKNSKNGIYVKIKKGKVKVYIPDSCMSGEGKSCSDKDDEIEVER